MEIPIPALENVNFAVVFVVLAVLGWLPSLLRRFRAGIGPGQIIPEKLWGDEKDFVATWQGPDHILEIYKNGSGLVDGNSVVVKIRDPEKDSRVTPSVGELLKDPLQTILKATVKSLEVYGENGYQRSFTVMMPPQERGQSRIMMLDSQTYYDTAFAVPEGWNEEVKAPEKPVDKGPVERF